MTILAHLFSDQLKRETLWERIGSAVKTSLAKVGADETAERFIHFCLEHVQADDARAAACEALQQLLGELNARGTEWQQEWLAYFAQYRLPALVYARQRWELVKKKEVEL